MGEGPVTRRDQPPSIPSEETASFAGRRLDLRDLPVAKRPRPTRRADAQTMRACAAARPGASLPRPHRCRRRGQRPPPAKRSRSARRAQSAPQSSRAKLTAQGIASLLMRKVFEKFFADRGTHLAAMIAYFALLSFVPLLFLALALLGFAGRADESSFLVTELNKAFPTSSVDGILRVIQSIQDNAATLGVSAPSSSAGPRSRSSASSSRRSTSSTGSRTARSCTGSRSR